ncbi:MAG: ferrous iron transport protein B [Holophagales bacterium]|nr:ferrous iron transport protein B [Holophagales bacterium]
MAISAPVARAATERSGDSPVPEPEHSGEPAVGPVEDRRFRVALLGNPNTGKTTLFNRLCGLRAKTANFPGTTTDARIGTASLRPPGAGTGPPGKGSPGTGPREIGSPGVGSGDGLGVEVLDLPGTYRLSLGLPEARICRDVLAGSGPHRRPDAAVVVVDATNLGRNLQLVGELLAFELPTVVALNMVDIAQRRGLTLDAAGLGERLGCPVVPIVARKGAGVDALEQALSEILTARPRSSVERRSEPGFAEGPKATERSAPPNPRLRELLREGELGAWAQAVLDDSVGGPQALGSDADTVTERLDQAFTHPILGVLVFVAIMGGLFWTVFALATVPMDLIEATFEVLGGWLVTVLPEGAVRDLLVEGVVGGIAGTVVFLPQICLLFFLISLLEDTGYLARAAFVMDRILCRFGLPGHAFVPMLSSHACALPGILSTRLIPDRRDRLATILVAPFMSCSARLPVYVLLTGLLFHDRPLLGGLAFAACYLLGGAVALLSALLLRRTLLRGRSRPMVLELPTYKLPSLRSALYAAVHQGRTFLENAGTVIVAICVVMWWLSAYPAVEPPPEAEAMRAEAEASADPMARAELMADADFLEAKHAQAQSFAGRLGRTAQPVFAPLGYDWQLTVGVLTSFLAREVFVSTMAVLLVGDESLAEDSGVIARVRDARRDDGTPLFTTATAASLLVFFVLAMQCLPTLAVTRREAGGWKWAALQLIYMSSLAWIFAYFTYHGIHWAGWA